MRVGSRHVGFGLTLLSFALAFAQRPGRTTADTKIDLHVDPAGFLGDVASVWSSSGGLGQVQAGQYSGYLWPMGPFYALGDAAGLPPWVIHRLWLGLLLALAAWGVVKLLEPLMDEPRALAQAVAGALFVVNPYVTTFTQVTSVTLLGYAALPWLLLAVQRGLRRRGGWWWPALFALVFTSTGGGVNAAVTGWLLLGPLLLLLFEWRSGAVARPAAWAFAWRTAVLSVAASLWWVLPVALHAAFGINFLPFTESAGAIWSTTSIPESLRLMGYWLSYLGAGFGKYPLPYFDASQELLFGTPVVLASLLVPALAIGSLVWTRRWRYAPFFLLLLLAGLLVMSAGFPPGTPLRRALTETYDQVSSVQFLRTTYKAGPLVALALACLAGAGARELWRRLGTPALRAAACLAGAVLVAAAAWPLASGRALDPKFTFDEIPAAWQQAADDVDGELGPNARALILPGQLYGFYDWGATVDPILPALAERPVASKTAVPYADLHAVDALWTVDSGVQQERFVPGQLDPLLRWLAAGKVVTGSDDLVERTGSTAPAETARSLDLAGLGDPDAELGERRIFEPDGGSLTQALELPRVRVYDRPGAALVRLEPREGGVLLDGSAEGVAALAAFGGLDPSRPLRYAGDSGDGELRAAVETADELVVTDSNRRRAVSPARPRQTWGRTLQEDEPLPDDAPRLEPFGDERDGQTLARLDGVDYVRAPFSPGFPQFPEHRPFAAIDGDPGTWWEADRELLNEFRWIEVGFDGARDVPWVELLPREADLAAITRVEVGEREFDVEPGWNRLEVGLEDVRKLRVRILRRDLPDFRHGGPGAIAEIRVPGVRARERIRPPLRLERAAAPLGPSVALTYLFARVTGDRPFRRQPVSDPDAAAVPGEETVEPALIREAGDAESAIVREIEPPAARAYTAAAWVSAAADSDDASLDRLAGYRGPGTFRSSARFEGRPGARASKAFDGDASTAWVGRHVPGSPAWVDWREPGARTLRRLALAAPPPPAELPTRVRLRAGDEVTPELTVGPAGELRLPDPLRGEAFRLEVVSAPTDAVGVAEIAGEGVPRAAIPRSGELRGRCGDLRVSAGDASAQLRVSGRVEDLDRSYPLRAEGCGELRLPAGRQVVEARGGTLLPYLLQLRSAPGGQAPQRPAGRVLDPGDAEGSNRDGVRLAVDAPARLVLAESFNEGWRASCDGHDLGKPEIAAGFANGWDVPAGCREAEFRFAPQAAANAGYLLSGGACVLLLILLIAYRARRRCNERAPSPNVSWNKWGRGPFVALRARPLPAAVALALPVAAAVAFAFALRAGAVAFPLLLLLLWRGATVRALLLTAGALLAVVVPLLYLLFPPDDGGGHNSAYTGEILAAHWVAVAAVALLLLALWRMLRDAARPATE